MFRKYSAVTIVKGREYKIINHVKYKVGTEIAVITTALLCAAIMLGWDIIDNGNDMTFKFV